jgi:hypothetical protein
MWNKRHQIGYLSLVTILLCNISCSSSKAIVATKPVPFVTTPMSIDGMASDWKNIPFTFEPNTLVRYAIANDTSNLYVCITSTSPGVNRKIFKMGMKVFFDTAGERKEFSGVQFPMPIDDNALQLITAAGNGNPKTTEAEYRRFVKLQENQYSLFGFPDDNGLNAISTTDYITLNFTLDQDDIFIYEMKVPFKSIFGSPLPADVLKRSMSIGIEIEGLPKSQDPNAPVASEIGMPGSQMTGARINMGKGGGLDRNPYGYTNQTMYKDQKTFIKFALSSK